MKNLANKKYSVILFLIGFFGIIISYIASHNFIYLKGGYYPVELFSGVYLQQYESAKAIDFGLFILGLRSISIFMVVLIAYSVFLFLYKTDEEIKNFLVVVKKRIFTKELINITLINKSIAVKTAEINEYNIEKSKESIKYNKIADAKSDAAIYGVLFGAIQIGIYVMSKNIYWEDSTKIILNFSIILILRIFSAYKCNMLSKYNLGNSWFWFLFGVLMPSVALIFASMPFLLNKEIQELKRGINEEKKP